MPTKFNKEYFDKIDSSDKAYWIGFIWSDGSVMYRKRKSEEYLLKIDLAHRDYEHLKKFNENIEGEYEVKTYYNKTSFSEHSKICRISVYNKHFVKNLMDKYGIFSYRTDATKILSEIPKEYKKDFIRGIFDADGSFSAYTLIDKKKGYILNKKTLRFGATVEILRYIEDYLIENGVINNFKRKLTKRHEERDGCYFQLSLSGKQNVMDTLDLLYKNSDVFLDRKYEKYMKMKEGGSNINQE